MSTGIGNTCSWTHRYFCSFMCVRTAREFLTLATGTRTATRSGCPLRDRSDRRDSRHSPRRSPPSVLSGVAVSPSRKDGSNQSSRLRYVRAAAWWNSSTKMSTCALWPPCTCRRLRPRGRRATGDGRRGGRRRDNRGWACTGIAGGRGAFLSGPPSDDRGVNLAVHPCEIGNRRSHAGNIAVHNSLKEVISCQIKRERMLERRGARSKTSASREGGRPA